MLGQAVAAAATRLGHDVVALSRAELDVTASDAWSALVREFPALESYSRNVSCAVNEEYARLTAALKEGDDVAFLPPVSGG